MQAWQSGLAASSEAGTASEVPRGLVYRRHVFAWRSQPHPFAQRLMPSSDSTSVFHSPAAGGLLPLVADHVVQGRVIFPGAGYLEMARASGAEALHGVYFLHPLAVDSSTLLVECVISDGRFEVRSGEEGMLADASVHCSGAIAAANAWQIVCDASRCHCSHAADVTQLYDGFNVVGLQYGPGFRSLMQAWGGVRDALAWLHARTTHEGTQVHPADLDDALCTSAVIPSSGGEGETRLPFAVDDAMLRGAMGKLWAVRRSSHEPPTTRYAAHAWFD